jgi:predicted DNA-binding transcriptional regulator AlpA
MSQMKPNNESNSYQAEKIGRAMLGLQGMNISLQPPGHVGCQFLTVNQVAEALAVNRKWVCKHLDEFPHWASLSGREIRISLSDIQAALVRWRIQRD